MKKNKELIEVSWELFLKTGDPFYILAKNTFEKTEKKRENKKIEEDGLINS